MDFEAIKKAAQAYGPDMTRFLRDMIAIPSESCEEKGVAHRIAEEMKKLGYDKVEFDALDKLGGLDTALADMAKELGVESWSVERYPKTEDDVLTALLMMSDRMEQSALERKLGDVAEIYRTIESIRQYQGVQARMQPVVIE